MSEMSGMPSRNSTPASPSATSAPKSRKLCQKASRAKLHASTAPMTTPFQTTGLRHARTRIAADGIAPVLMNPKVLSGMFLGSMMAFLFCGLTMNAVGRAAAHMVDEVRRQFREIKGILTGETEPDYERCVAISTKGAQREMVVPSLIAIITPIATGLIFGVPGVLGLLIGGLSSGFVLAIFMANAGGAWDNAKKYVEEGNFGGKGSEVHKATVVGDTVGDPFKDTSGPSLNILIKLMSMVAIVMAGLTVAWSLF